MSLGFVDKRFCGQFQCVLALDNDVAALTTHKNNIGGEGIACNIEEWLKESTNIPHADVVIGGPPCQGFSLLNKNRKGDSRRELWEPYMDVVRRSGARVFVMENVAELLKSAEFDKIRERAEEYGFHVTAKVLNAANYGAPQLRRRAVIVGWNAKRGMVAPNFPPAETHSAPTAVDNLPDWLTVRDAIGNLPEPIGTEVRNCDNHLDLHFGRNPTKVSLARYKVIPAGGNRFDLLRNAPELTPQCWIRKTSGGTDLFGRLWWDKPSVTIRTEFFKPEKGRYLHPEKHRPITHREAARLMGFPDDFKFFGSKTEIARQIGNAVPPPLSGAIAKMVTAMLDTSVLKKAA